MRKAIKKAKTTKGPSAPSSTMFGKKPVLAKGKKKSELASALDTLLNLPDQKPKKAKKPIEKTAGEKRVDNIVEKMKSAKKQKPISKLPSKLDKAIEETITNNRKSYANKANAPCFGDAIIQPDAKGFDGHSDIVTFESLPKSLKNNLSRTKDSEKYAYPKIDKICVKNLWIWNNWCDRLWFETQNSDPPTKRLVVIPLSDVIPFDNVDMMIQRLRSNSDFKQALANLGHRRYKVRLIPKIEGEVKTRTLNWINDLMSSQTGIKTIQGIYLPDMHIDDIPRDVAFGVIPHQRKLSEVERFIDDLIDTKKRAVIRYETLRLLGSKISEIKQTAIYKKFKQSWGLQNPLIEVTTAMSESKVRKLSRLGDIIVNSTGDLT